MHTTGTATIEKVSIIVSKGSLEGIYPALIMANAGNTSSWPPSGTRDCTCRLCWVACPASRTW
ncbi:hypothetical protein [Streptomyces sp. 351MFTsu5.1]|uniref:hypothetical protein n=1 Tax=Streptomyces sp. 351MFTsu5.1 TaxID=1172180 RepID=UPI000399EAFE|nr:hypothetical protein [Streptomyces sp. 351MFTsu5.1]